MRLAVVLVFISFSFLSFSQSEKDIDNSIAYADSLMDNDIQESFFVLESAIKESKSIGYKKGEADGYYKLSEFYRVKRKGDECIEHLYKALEIYKEINFKKGVADAYNDIGLSYDEFGLDGDIVGYYQKSLDINKSIDNKEDMVVNYMNISTFYQSKGDNINSFAYLDTSIAIAESIGDSVLMAHAIHSKGYLHNSLGEYEEAISNYKVALDIYKAKNMDYYQIAPMINLVSIYNKYNDKFKESIKLLKEAEALSLKLDDKFYISMVYKFLNTIYADHGDYKSAYDYHKLYKSYSDSLSDTESEKRLVELKMQHEFDIEMEQVALEQEKKDLASAEELKRSELTRNAFIAGFVLILILAIVSFRAFRNKKRANQEIAEKNKEITDSINYAERLQTAILSPSNETDNELSNLVVLFQPKDIVSGDFYWVEKLGTSIMFSAIDCTGHGVPGAMLSIVGNNALENIIHNKGICQPSKILTELNKAVYSKLKVKGNREMGDGMDAAFCRLDTDKNLLEFSGANNPLYIVRDGEVIVHKGTKTAIGQEPDTIFGHNEIFLQEGDCVYVFSDGYSDQFGGERGKKLGSKEFKRFLVSIQNEDMDTQRDLLQKNIQDWMINEEQIDDICVIGIKV